MNDKIIIISGDPNSVSSEIIFKSWNELNKVIKKIATKFNHNNKIYATKSDGKSFIVNIKKFERLFFKLSTTSNSLLRFILVNK